MSRELQQVEFYALREELRSNLSYDKIERLFTVTEQMTKKMQNSLMELLISLANRDAQDCDLAKRIAGSIYCRLSRCSNLEAIEALVYFACLLKQTPGLLWQDFIPEDKLKEATIRELFVANPKLSVDRKQDVEAAAREWLIDVTYLHVKALIDQGQQFSSGKKRKNSKEKIYLRLNA